ncbi:hypothetical protein HK105_200434 [Polyrhizophydium stewartii]|uniref:Transmembrane protein n=1 Tax=Polyrhizophydium stewartii TaxID=2732419 RepID=A0ABR4NLG1_9FUNG
MIPPRLAISISLCLSSDRHILYPLAQMSSAIQTQVFLLAELEMLRLLLPEYGVLSPTIVTRLQIASAAVASIILLLLCASAAQLAPERTVETILVGWMSVVGLYDTMQQILMLHFVLSRLRNPPALFRTKFAAMTAACVALMTAGVVLDLAMTDVDMVWTGFAIAVASAFLLVSAEAMCLLRETACSRPLVVGMQGGKPSKTVESAGSTRGVAQSIEMSEA